MGSFRNRLLVLIIGLVVVTQSVTTFAVLARVKETVEGRATGELGAGGVFVEQMIRFRALAARQRRQRAGVGLRIPRSDGFRRSAHTALCRQ